MPEDVSAIDVKMAMYKSDREHAEAEISQGIRRPLRSTWALRQSGAKLAIGLLTMKA